MRVLSIAIFAALSASLGAAAQTQSAAPAAPSASQEAPLTEGEVRRINKEQKKITLRHGAIQALEMPPMTMVFNVRDPALLDKVQVGDKVRFAAEKAPDGAFFVTTIEKP